MANAYNYSNTAIQTTLSGNISNSATSFTVGATTGFPASTPYVLALDYGAATEELVVVTGVAGTTLTVTRGFSGTSAQSHSIGAVVRHVYNAQDATDFRTHEAATSDVHGVTGALVGATQTQTLTNKTFTTPTINGATLTGTMAGTPTFNGAVVLSGTPNISAGAALAGTFTGTPTFSGNVAFSGTPTFSNQALAQRASVSLATWRASVSGDSNDRFYVQADGGLQWSSGSAAPDTNLYRSAVNTLKTDDSFTAIGTLSAAPTDTSLNGLAVSLPNSTTADLLNLQTNGSLVAAMGSDGMFRNYAGNSPNVYTPTVTNGGSVTWTTRTGYWWRLGKIVFVVAYLSVNVAGSGSSNVAITMPTSVDRTTRQVLGMSAEGVGLNGHSHVMFFTGGSGATSDRIRSYDGQNLIGSDLLAGGLLTIQGWYREA